MKDYIKKLFEKMFGKQKKYLVGPATFYVYNKKTGEEIYHIDNYEIIPSIENDPEWNIIK